MANKDLDFPSLVSLKHGLKQELEYSVRRLDLQAAMSWSLAWYGMVWFVPSFVHAKTDDVTIPSVPPYAPPEFPFNLS